MEERSSRYTNRQHHMPQSQQMPKELESSVIRSKPSDQNSNNIYQNQKTPLDRNKSGKKQPVDKQQSTRQTERDKVCRDEPESSARLTGRPEKPVKARPTGQKALEPKLDAEGTGTKSAD